jgi:NAD(P)H-hydrate epimerase
MPVTTLSPDWVSKRLPARASTSDKRMHGRVLVVGGCEYYIGAPALAAQAAYRVGAGLVTLCVPPAIKPIVATLCPEATHLPATELSTAKLHSVSAVLVGPGMGQADEARTLLRCVLDLKLKVPHVLDADALNLLAPITHPQTSQTFQTLPAQGILTPHAAEMARLLNSTVADVQNNRAAVATRAANEWQQVVVLKGAHTVIAGPDQTETATLPFANPALAVAGTGDVLAGCVAGLLAQGLGLFDAAACGAFLHGYAGELWRKHNNNADAGLLASDLLPLLPQARAALSH